MMEARSIAVRPDEQRAHVRGMWAAVASGWGEHAEWIDGRGADVTAALLAARRLQPGEVVPAAAVPGMTTVAAWGGERLGLGNVSSRELDLEQIDEPDGCYDAVVC